jgi:serine/threonine protein phosphatase PrpC
MQVRLREKKIGYKKDFLREGGCRGDQRVNGKIRPKAACQAFVRMAGERGGEDNITAIVARFNSDGPPEPKPKDVADSTNMKIEEPPRRRSFWPWRR